MQILVLGMHRAGTSLAARLVNMMGAYFGPEQLALGASPDNPKGFWERQDVVHINRSVLRHFGCVWYKVDRWDDRQLHAVPPPLTHAIRALVAELDTYRPWMIKDPRLCLTLPCWLKWLTTPVAVITTREPLEIARSLELRNGMPIEYGLALWEFHAVHIIRHTHALPRVIVSYEATLAQPVENARKLHAALLAHGVPGLTMPAEREIRDFVEPSLQRADKKDTRDILTAEQRALAAMLHGETPFNPTIEASPQARRIMHEMGHKVSGAPIN